MTEGAIATRNNGQGKSRRLAGGRWALFLPLVLLAACAVERNPLNVYTETGQNLGPLAFHDIALADSKVSFDGDDPTKRREAQALVDRYSERITFKNNAVIRYNKVFKGGFKNGWTDADSLQADVDNSTFYKDRAIVFDRAKIRSGGYYTYLLQSSPTDNCFVLRGIFGDPSDGRAGNRGDQEITGTICYRANSKSLDDLEREMTGLLARARFDGGTGNRAQVQQAAVAPPPTVDTSNFVTCYSQRLDSLYHARLCAKSDRPVAAVEAAQITGRLAKARPMATGGMAFFAATPGTTITTSDGGFLRVVGVDDMVMTMVNSTGSIDQRFGLFLSTGPERNFDARAAESIWPLAVGKEVNLVLSRDSESWQVALKVLRTESLTIRAGTFETYVVERHDRGMGSNSYEAIRTFWYAPSIGAIVKFDHRHISGNPGNYTPWEAVSIARPTA
jgi:hypothetical protein